MAKLSTGYSFGATEEVTAEKLHALVDDASISGIVTADINDSAITNAKISDVSGAKFTGLANIPAGAGDIPVANLGSGTPSSSNFLRGDGSWASPIETIYPIGSLYISTLSTNPATLLGFGTWTTFGAGKVLVGLNASDGDFDTVEETGGAKTANLAHTHLQNMGDAVNANPGLKYTLATSGDNAPTYASGNEGGYYQVKTGVQSGGSATQSIVQPYIVVYIWKRTA